MDGAEEKLGELLPFPHRVTIEVTMANQGRYKRYRLACLT